MHLLIMIQKPVLFNITVHWLDLGDYIRGEIYKADGPLLTGSHSVQQQPYGKGDLQNLKHSQFIHCQGPIYWKYPPPGAIANVI